MTLWLTPSLPLVAFGNTVPYPKFMAWPLVVIDRNSVRFRPKLRPEPKILFRFRQGLRFRFRPKLRFKSEPKFEDFKNVTLQNNLYFILENWYFIECCLVYLQCICIPCTYGMRVWYIVWYCKKNYPSYRYVHTLNLNTVKLGYNELGYNELGYNKLGYNEHSVITNKFFSPN